MRCWHLHMVISYSGGGLRGRAASYVGCGGGIFVKMEDEVYSRKNKGMVVGKREAGVSWKIGEEIVEEVKEIKHLGVWINRKPQGNVQLEKMAKKDRRVDWKVHGGAE